MMAGVVAGQARLLAPVSAALWTPLNMAVVPQIYLDAHDSVVTDVSGTCSAISNLGVMGANGDFSQGTAGNRPSILAAELNGKRVLRFDGADDVLRSSGSTARSLFNGVQTAWAFSVHKKRAVSADLVSRVLFQSTIGTTTGSRFTMAAGMGVAGVQNSPSLLGRALDSDTQSNLYGVESSPSQYVMALTAFHTLERWGRVYVNGTVVSENPAFIAAGYFSTSPTASSADLSIGAFTAGSGFADVDLATFIAGREPAGGVLLASAIDKLFGWAAHKYGLTANLPAGHPYKTLAPTV